MLAHPAKLWRINTDLYAAGYGYGTKMSPRNQTVPLVESQHHVIDPTNPGGALDDGVEDRLHVRRRAADDAEHLGRCRLMLQGLAQFCVALLDSLNSRTFSMAITAWSAKVSRSSICFSVKGRTSVRRIRISSNRRPLRAATAWPEQFGCRKRRASKAHISETRVLHCHNIMNMNGSSSNMARPRRHIPRANRYCSSAPTRALVHQ